MTTELPEKLLESSEEEIYARLERYFLDPNVVSNKEQFCKAFHVNSVEEFIKQMMEEKRK